MTEVMNNHYEEIENNKENKIDIDKDTVNLLKDIVKIKEDWQITTEELMNIEEDLNKISVEQKDIIDSTRKDLRNLAHDILEKWITINESNKNKVIKFLEKEWFKVPEEIKNREWEFGITINEKWEIVEEGFFSTKYNNDKIDIKDKKVLSEWFNSKLAVEYLNNEGKEIIKQWLENLKKHADKVPWWENFISKMEEFINEWYDQLNNEEKMLFVTLFDKIRQWDYKWAIAHIEYSTPIIEQLPWMYVWLLWAGALMLAVVAVETSVAVWAILTVWWILASVWAATGYFNNDIIGKKIKFNHKYVDGDNQLREDNIL